MRKPLIASDGTELYPLRHRDGKWRGLAVYMDQVMATGPAFETEAEAWASCEAMLFAADRISSKGGAT